MHLILEILGADDNEGEIPDERLRLIFTCCHPALELKSRVALTLRAVCGLSTAEISRLFLDNETTMGQRLTRAKAKIASAGIAYVVPQEDQWDDRLSAVLTTIYLIFTTGYTSAPNEPRDLCGEALFLTRVLCMLRPEQAEIEGALALMLLTEARRTARVSPAGATVPPSEQDRNLWDCAKQIEGEQLLETALRRKRAGPFQVKAAISACQMSTPGPDWPQILQLYNVLLTMEPTPVVRVNHAVALAETGSVAVARSILQTLEGSLADFQPYHAALAHVLAKANDKEGAYRAYTSAIALADNESDRLFLKIQSSKIV